MDIGTWFSFRRVLYGGGLLNFKRPLPEILQQLTHAPVRYPHVHGLVRILYPHVGTPDKLQQFGQGVVVVIKFQIGIV